jgi:hypothetical protein
VTMSPADVSVETRSALSASSGSTTRAGIPHSGSESAGTGTAKRPGF